MNQPIPWSHRSILSGCFFFILFLMISTGLSGVVLADEGHGQSGEKSSPTPKMSAEGRHGMAMAPGGHSTKEKAHGPGMSTAGGHGEVPNGLTPLQQKGSLLISSLHCNACHYITPELEHGAGHGEGHAAVAPDLTNLGDKFRPDWLFDFLRKPHTIRPWLKIRMPDFRLTEQEATAQVRHISKDMRGVSQPSLPSIKLSPAKQKAFLEAGKKLMSADYFDCWSCHQKGELKPEGPMEGWAPDLEISSQRLRRDWIVQWLQDPQKLMPGTKMPTYFEGSDSGPDEILGGDETKQIVAIVEYVLSLRSSPEKLSAYAAAKKRHPGATRAWGARLMGDLNCAGCHDVGGMHERLEAGPPLAHEGSRVRKKWLVEFLKNPSQIRPIGYAEGHSSRMPNFRLTSDEAETLAEYLISLEDKRTHGHEKPHSVQKAQAKRGARLFASLRCKTCHQIKDDLDKSPPSGFGGPSLAHAAEHVTKDQPERGVSSGFRGPNLTHAGRRLKENHLRLWFMGDVTRSGSKLEMDAHPLVPAMGLTREQIEELSAYVVTLK